MLKKLVEVDNMNSRVYRVAEIFGNLFLLNVLWLLFCIPVVTAFPATAAMFGVVRDWIRSEDSACLEPFIRHLKANFVHSLGIGLVWTVLGAFLAADFVALSRIEVAVRLPLLVILALLALAYVLTSIYLFPVMVNYSISWRGVIRNSFLIALGQIGTTVQCLLVIVVMNILLYYAPPTILVWGSGTAYLLYFLCQRAFGRVEALKTTGQ